MTELIWTVACFNESVNVSELDQLFSKLTGQLADKPTRGQSSRGLDNSRTGQLADSKFIKKIMELLNFICTLNLTLTLTL